MKSLLEVRHFTKYYNTFKALDDVSITIMPNEVYGFIGRNGAGKTTTINCLLSLINRDAGDVFFHGVNIASNVTAFLGRIGYVPDVPSFPSYLTARECLSIFADMHGLTAEKDEKIGLLLNDVALPDSKQKISGYSRGMKQRLAIAQALINDPELLIMDEPTSALDPIGRKDVIDIIGRLKEKTTVFYSTHILEDAQKVCDRIGLIENGQIIFENDLSILLDRGLSTTYHLETNMPADALVSKLGALPYTDNIARAGAGVRFGLKDETGVNALIELLIADDIEIVHIEKCGKTLEDVFLEVLHEGVA